MDLDQIPLFAMLKSKLSYDSQRQKVIAQNVANSDTPGFAPRDLKSFSFDAALSSAQGTGGAGGVSVGGVALAGVRAAPGHMDLGVPTIGTPESAAMPDSEARLDGNQVVLEEQMIKMSDAQGDFNAAIGLYQQSLTMMRTAIRKPGS